LIHINGVLIQQPPLQIATSQHAFQLAILGHNENNFQTASRRFFNRIPYRLGAIDDVFVKGVFKYHGCVLKGLMIHVQSVINDSIQDLTMI
jgi:hypothetical protein